MRIAIIVEGRTEQAFGKHLNAFLRSRLAGKMPKLDFVPWNGPIPKGGKLKQAVQNLLKDTNQPADAVIALTDIYTGTNPPEFSSAEDAKRKMREWVGEEPRFHPHVALHDFEAWLLPYWDKIKRLAGSNRASPNARPELVNHGKPPSFHLAEVFATGTKRISYLKTREPSRILKDEDLSVAIEACPELRALVSTILNIAAPDGTGDLLHKRRPDGIESSRD